MNANRVLKVESSSTLRKEHSSMATALSDCHGSRPDNLLPGIRKFPDQDRANMWSPCSNCSSDENNSPTALNSFNWDKPALEDKSVDFGWAPAQNSNNCGWMGSVVGLLLASVPKVTGSTPAQVGGFS
ncbi:uncharacterized protein TNCV_2385691 [Trichonephila clavipes]|nr:uncharacterized protein TNCV_2385691 [Trichonephila clavipes]